MSSVGATSGPLSASAIVGQAGGSGSHILRVEGYSVTKGLGNGQYVASETFTAGGHRWRLLYYPNYNSFDSLVITLSHRECNCDGDVEASFTVSLLDHDGSPAPSYSRAYQHTFSYEYYTDDEWGDDDLIEKSELEKSAYLKDDVFYVRCDVTVVNKIFTKAIPVSEVPGGAGDAVKKKRERS